MSSNQTLAKGSTMTKFRGVTLTTFVDPFPGLKGTDRVNVDCPSCGGDGVYHAPTGYSIRNPRTGGAFPGCFACMGHGTVSRTVQSQRLAAKKAAHWAEFGQAEDAAQREAAVAAYQAAEFAQAWDDAQVEQARRAALVTGFVGEVGQKVVGLTGVVKFAKYNPGCWNRSATMFIIVDLDGGQVVKISGSSESLFSVERNDRIVIISAKVKGQESYNGQDQSVLSHVKVEVISVDEDEEVNA